MNKENFKSLAIAIFSALTGFGVVTTILSWVEEVRTMWKLEPYELEKVYPFGASESPWYYHTKQMYIEYWSVIMGIYFLILAVGIHRIFKNGVRSALIPSLTWWVTFTLTLISSKL